QLVGEEPRRHVAAGLPAVEEAEPEERGRQRDRLVEAIDSRGGDCGRLHYLTIETAGGRAMARPTNFPGTPASKQAFTTPSTRSAGASGIVTITASGLTVARIRAMSSVLPWTATPSSRRRWRLGLSSTKPTTCSPGVSRSSRARLRPERPAPT